MLAVFWAAFGLLAAGLSLWLAFGDRAPAPRALTAGLMGLFAMPLLRLAVTIASAIRTRDRILLLSTLAVLAILLALTIRDAARSG